MVANAITASRLFGALLLPPIGPDDFMFWLLYAWCGVSDMVDGMIARMLGMESVFGANLDSAADLIFAISCCFCILPNCSLEPWLVVATVLIAAARVLLCMFLWEKGGDAARLHSKGNKVAGFSVFVTLPILYCTGMSLVALPACILSILAILQEALDELCSLLVA